MYALSTFGSQTPETIHATRLAWTAGLGRATNELLLARVDDRRRCHANTDFSQVHVFIEQGEMLAGAASACHGDEIGYTIWELTDNVGITSGSHRITLGTPTSDRPSRRGACLGAGPWGSTAWELSSRARRCSTPGM